MSVTVNSRGRRFEAYASAKRAGQLVRDRKSGFQTYEAAEAWGRQRELDLESGVDTCGPTSGSPSTWGQLCGLAFDSLWADGPSASASKASIDSLLGHFGAESRTYRQLKTADIDGFIRALRDAGNGNSTIRRKLSALGKILRWAHAREWIDTVPRIPSVAPDPGRTRWASREEEDELVGHLRARGQADYADLVVVLADTGLRVAEALGLTWGDISDTGDILVRAGSSGRSGKSNASGSKSRVSRTVPMTTRVRELMRGRRGFHQDGPFAGLKANSFNYQWRQVKALIGLEDDDEFVPHCLRHGVASRLAKAGVHLLVIKDLLGHKSIETTLRYAHLDDSDLRSAVDQVLERGPGMG